MASPYTNLYTSKRLYSLHASVKFQRLEGRNVEQQHTVREYLFIRLLERTCFLRFHAHSPGWFPDINLFILPVSTVRFQTYLYH